MAGESNALRTLHKEEMMQEINEGALKKALNEAYKAGGYTIDRNVPGLWRISADGWKMTVPVGELPWSVMAKIVEHTGIIPNAGALKIDKEGVQTIMEHDFYWRSVEKRAQPCGLTTDDGMNLWKSEDGWIWGVPEDRMEILMARKTMAAQNEIAEITGESCAMQIQAERMNETELLGRLGIGKEGT